jgi:hypothetical protein
MIAWSHPLSNRPRKSIVILTGLTIAALLLAAYPALLFRANLRQYLPPPELVIPPGEAPPQVSVLIPARNEERAIGAAVEAALASTGVDIEVVVLDDHSEDGTARVVRELAARDSRVRLVSGPPLPRGWCGKQHACAVLGREARYSLLLFVDADVRLAPTGVARLVAFQRASNADLVSGVPFQETGTLLERLLIPLIHFILLGFLPLARMRRSRSPALAAGCGQLFLARRSAYEQVGGHGAVRTSLHDGLTLPRAFRQAGLMTDLCDATDVASCRMYRSAGEVWFGLAKNATEGLARPLLIGPATLLLLGGQVLPMLLLGVAGVTQDAVAVGPALLATVLLYYPRAVGISRFRQSVAGALMHPLGVTLLVMLQWFGLLRTTLGRPATWKGRSYQEPGKPLAERTAV